MVKRNESPVEEIKRLKAENKKLKEDNEKANSKARRYDEEHRDDRYDPMG